MKMIQKAAAVALAVSRCSAADSAPQSGKTERPNVLIIITDDQGYGDLSFHGNTVLETPHMDRLAAESAQMNYFYVAPVCAPTRAALLTGRNHMEAGVWGVHLAREYLSLDETTIADILSANGYDTAMIGKWHSGRAPAWMPWNRGFKEAWVSDLYKHLNGPVSHNGRLLATQGWSAETLTDLAMDWIRRDRDGQPFFLLMAHMAPHGPWEAPEKFILKYKTKGCSDRLSVLYGMIDHLDDQVGRLLSELDQAGLRDNTLVIFLSDNGPTHKVGGGAPLSEQDIETRNLHKLRGVKGNLWENGIRVPCFIRWPAKIQPGPVAALADVMDLFPTILAAAAIEPPQGNLPIHGQSLLPVLAGSEREWPWLRQYFKPFWQPYWREGWVHDGTLENIQDVTYENQVMVLRQGPWKLVKNRNSRPELYNILSDPGETKDLADRHVDKTRELTKQIQSEFESMIGTGRCFLQPRFHIGHPEYDKYDQVGGNLSGSQIPCCSSVRVTGNVAVKEHHSEGWSGPGDSQTIWVDVVAPGTYAVELKASGATPGAEVQLQIGDSVLNATVTRSGGTAALGSIRLNQGPQDMTLRLISLPAGSKAAFNQLSHIFLRLEE